MLDATLKEVDKVTTFPGAHSARAASVDLHDCYQEHPVISLSSNQAMDALLQRFLNPAYAVPLALLIIYTIYVRLTAGEATPVGVPWIGRDTSKYLSKLRATFASFKGFRPWLAEGYEKVRQPIHILLSYNID